MKPLPTFLAVITVAIGVAFAVPSDEERAAQAAENASQAGQQQSVEKADIQSKPNSWAQDITLTRAPDGHFYSDVEMDGYSAHMLIDTGASVVALTGADARAYGLEWNEDEVAAIARGANGAVYGVRTNLPSLSIGGLEARNVAAMIVPEGLDTSLLGQSYLSQVSSVEIAGDQMILSN